MDERGRGEPAWEQLTSALAATAACEDTTSAVQVVADALVQLLGADRVTINQVEPERGLIRILVHAGRLGDGDVERRPVDETYALDAFSQLDHTARDVRPWRTHVDDPDGDPAEIALLHRMGRTAAVAVPLMLDGRVWGEIYATRFDGPPFGAVDQHVVGVLGAHLGSVLTVLHRGDRRTAHAQVDPLTGLARRDAAERLVAAHADGVVLAAFDLDGLKGVNDEFGHAAGDRLLGEVADALVDSTAGLPGRLVARVGGDEFVVAVPGLDVDAVHAAAEKARAVVASVLPDAGLSCGIAASTDLSGPMGSGRPLFRLADATLYRAKRTGATEPLRAWRATGVTYSPALDGALTDGATPAWPELLGRLRGPVDVFARSVNAAAWWISHSPAGQASVITRDRLVLRDRREEETADIALLGAVFDLEHLPWTREALRGSSYYARINDPHVHPAEQLFLAELGYTGNLMAGVTIGDEAWLVEIYCDPVTAQVDRMGDSLLQLVRRALGLPAA